MTALTLGKVERYQHSGTVPLGVLVAAPLATFIVTFPCSFVLQKCGEWLGSLTAYGAVLVVLLYGILGGVVCGMVCSSLKLRNEGVATGIGFLSGLIVLYCNWNAHLKDLLSDAPWLLPLDGMWEWMTVLYHQGSWRLGSSGGNVTGGPLVLAWVFEALTILLFTVGMAAGFVAGIPFCELSKVWLETREAFDAFAKLESSELKEALKSGDLSRLLELPPPADRSGVLRVVLRSHPSAQTFFTLELSSITRSLDKRGAEQEASETVTPASVLPYAQLAPLRAFLESRVAPKAS